MAIKIEVPELGESVIEATVSAWHKKEGDFVNVGDVLVELETDKVNLEVGAKGSGVLTHIKAAEGDNVKIGEVLGEIEESAGQPALKEAPAQAVSQAESSNHDRHEGEKQKASLVTPVAARIAQDKGIDLSRVAGTGPEGRVTREDVEQFMQEGREPAPTETRPPVESPRMDAELAAGDERRVQRRHMSRRRRTIAQRLLEARQTTAMLTTFNEIDMSAVMDLRHRRNEEFQARYGIKLGITSFFVKASISALKAFPLVNAELQGDEILLKQYYDIGVAIGAEEGLVVPVIRSADRLTFAEIESRIKELIAKSDQGKLSVDDLRGGTFTITNGGVFGSLFSTPILNPPQVAILGLHKIEERPIALNGEVVIRPMMYVALSYDHRLIDGREAVQFLARIKQLVEDPERLLLEG